MKFRAKILIVNKNETYREMFEAVTDNPTKYVQSVLDNFNKTLKPGESRREISGHVRVLDFTNRKEHDWEKTNLVTIKKAGRMFDTWRCSSCGITAKRFGIGGPIVIDPKYKKADYKYCK